jgi:deoxyribonuclease-4
MNKLTLGWHTSISPSIIDGIKFNEKSHKTINKDWNVSAQIFLKAPMKVGKSKLMNNEDICKKVKQYISENNIYLVVHGQYIINFIKTDNEWAVNSVVDDILLLDKMTPEDKKSKTGVIIHMGKNTNKESIEQCIENFYKNVKIVLDKTKDCKVKLILETSTKTKNGNDIFYNIETFGKLKSYLKDKFSENEYSRIGYCIDTAHIFASGYNIKTQETFEDFISLWDHHIGINEITLFHLNDSKVDLGCCRDLHEQIGSGLIFSDDKNGLTTLLNFSKTNNIPIIIESGGDQVQEIELISSLI